MSIYAPDVVAYDMTPPLRFRGIDAYRKDYEDYFDAYDGPVDVELRDVAVVAVKDVAVAFGLQRFKGKPKSGDVTDFWARFTSAFRKIDGKWLDVHDHDFGADRLCHRQGVARPQALTAFAAAVANETVRRLQARLSLSPRALGDIRNQHNRSVPTSAVAVAPTYSGGDPREMSRMLSTMKMRPGPWRRDVPQRIANIAGNRASIIDFTTAAKRQADGGSDAICGKRGDTT